VGAAASVHCWKVFNQYDLLIYNYVYISITILLKQIRENGNRNFWLGFMYWLPSGRQVNLYPKYDKQLAARWVVATVIAVFDIGNQTILFSLPSALVLRMRLRISASIDLLYNACSLNSHQLWKWRAMKKKEMTD
jgi:hypothetical protein